MTVLVRPTPHPSVGSPTPSYYPGGKIPADKFDSLTLLAGVVFVCLVGLAIMKWLNGRSS